METLNNHIISLIVNNKNLFYKCQNLKTIDLPKVTEVGDRTFMDCKNLKSISLSSIQKIHQSAFRGCTALKLFQLPKNSPVKKRKTIQNLRVMNNMEIKEV